MLTILLPEAPALVSSISSSRKSRRAAKACIPEGKVDFAVLHSLLSRQKVGNYRGGLKCLRLTTALCLQARGRGSIASPT
jgi:hypothetical protein